jgi:hypothetical protein
MGRPPKGDRAMTGAERLRAHRERQRGQRPVTEETKQAEPPVTETKPEPVTKPVTPPEPDPRDAVIARLKAEIETLKRDAAASMLEAMDHFEKHEKLKEAVQPGVAAMQAEIEKLKAESEERKTKLWEANGLLHSVINQNSKLEAQVGKLEAQAERWTKAEAGTPEAVAVMADKIEQLEKQLKAARSQITTLSLANTNLRHRYDTLKQAPNQYSKLVLTKKFYNEIRFHLHPDRWNGSAAAAKRAEAAFQQFNEMKVVFTDDLEKQAEEAAEKRRQQAEKAAATRAANKQ